MLADANAFCEALWAAIAAEPADTEKRAQWEGRVADLVGYVAERLPASA